MKYSPDAMNRLTTIYDNVISVSAGSLQMRACAVAEEPAAIKVRKLNIFTVNVCNNPFSMQETTP